MSEVRANLLARGTLDKNQKNIRNGKRKRLQEAVAEK
jgi:hypothetical protein